MRKTYSISGEYLYIPVNTKAKEKNVSFFIQEEEKAAEKWTQYRIAADESAGTEYSYDFMAELPIGRFKGKKLKGMCRNRFWNISAFRIRKICRVHRIR